MWIEPDPKKVEQRERSIYALIEQGGQLGLQKAVRHLAESMEAQSACVRELEGLLRERYLEDLRNQRKKP